MIGIFPINYSTVCHYNEGKALTVLLWFSIRPLVIRLKGFNIIDKKVIFELKLEAKRMTQLKVHNADNLSAMWQTCVASVRMLVDWRQPKSYLRGRSGKRFTR